MIERPDSEFADENVLERGDVKFRVNMGTFRTLKLLPPLLGKMVQLLGRRVEQNNNLLQ